MIDPAQIALLAAIAFAGALIFGITGFGSALVTIPLTFWITRPLMVDPSAVEVSVRPSTF